MNFNKLSLVVVVIGALLLGGIATVYLLTSRSAEPVTPDTTGQNNTGGLGSNNTVNVPSQNIGTATSSSDTKALVASGGGSVTVKNFLKDPATVKDPLNEGHYHIGPHPYQGVEDPTAMEAPPYVIEYIEAEQSFTISLLTEPLAQTRFEMEQFLMGKLGISASDMCHLNYVVSVPARVNSYFAGYSLGFSFCPDSIPL